MKQVTTEKHFQIFREEAKKWVDFFGLKGWNIEYTHADDVEDKAEGVCAWCVADPPQRSAWINLDVDWEGCDVTEERLRLMAFHEVCELLLMRISALALSRVSFTKEQLTEELHNIIRMLENSVFRQSRKHKP